MLFVALLPDAPAAARAEALTRRLVREAGLTGTPQAREKLHVTLLPLGTWDGVPRTLVARVAAAASPLGVPAFPVRFDRASTFDRKNGERHLVLRGADRQPTLLELHRRLQLGARMAGLEPLSGFEPHMTLVYGHRQPFATREVEPVEWMVRELVLIRSIVGQGRHIRLGQWSLSQAEA
jgi:2'-5' RNA ligase